MGHCAILLRRGAGRGCLLPMKQGGLGEVRRREREVRRVQSEGRGGQKKVRHQQSKARRVQSGGRGG